MLGPHLGLHPSNCGKIGIPLNQLNPRGISDCSHRTDTLFRYTNAKSILIHYRPILINNGLFSNSVGIPFFYAVIAVYSFSVRSLPARFAFDLADLVTITAIFLLTGLSAHNGRPGVKQPAQHWFLGLLSVFLLSAFLIGMTLFLVQLRVMEHFAYGVGSSFFLFLLFIADLWISSPILSATV
jgi:hypothetical protein